MTEVLTASRIDNPSSMTTLRDTSKRRPELPDRAGSIPGVRLEMLKLPIQGQLQLPRNSQVPGIPSRIIPSRISADSKLSYTKEVLHNTDTKSASAFNLKDLDGST